MSRFTSVKEKPLLYHGPESYRFMGPKFFVIVVVVTAFVSLAIVFFEEFSVLADEHKVISQNLAIDSQEDQPLSTGTAKKIRGIRFEVMREGEEKVFLMLNGFFPPDAFVLQGERPRAVCDFYDTGLGEGIGRCIEVNGRFIQQIRTGVYGGEKSKVRIVLDLVPGKNYEVEQIFFRKENLYTLVVKPKKGPSDK